MSIPVSYYYYYMIRGEAVVVRLLRVDLHTRCLAPVNSEREIYHNNKTGDWRQSTPPRQLGKLLHGPAKNTVTKTCIASIYARPAVSCGTRRRGCCCSCSDSPLLLMRPRLHFVFIEIVPEDKDDTSKGTYAQVNLS